MNNHLHVVLRNRPDVVATWDDETVALRWWNIFPKRRDETGGPAKPEPHELRMLIPSKKAVAELRRRLSDISWFMRCLAQPIAKRANEEDECTGHFFEGRFKCQVLADEAALLACSVYVDLNPVRAAIAATPETSLYTSIYERIASVQAARRSSGRSQQRGHRNRVPLRRRDAWLSPVELNERGRPGPQAASGGRRASDKGFLALSLERYLQLVDWTGRQVRGDKRGAIPAELRPILERVGLNEEVFVFWVERFKTLFKRFVGTPASLQDAAKAHGQRWFQAPGAAMLEA
jgi:hypothetical protein